MTNRRTPKTVYANAGFSFIEFIIVVMATVILMSAAVPNIARMQSEWMLWGGVRMLETSLQWGRMHAVSANTPVLFAVVDDRTFYCVDPVSNNPYSDSIRRLPAGLSIVSYPKRPLRFYQHGNAAPAGTYMIKGPTGSYSVVVSPGGRIRVQKN